VSETRESDTKKFLNYLHLSSLLLSKRISVAVILTLLPLLYFYPAVLGQVILMEGDGWYYNLSTRILAARMIAQGIPPLWNPYICAGMPLLASIQPGAIYPLNWLFAILSPGVAMNAVMIAAYYLAITGAYLYARRIGIGRVGAIITATIFTFGGYMIAHIEQTNIIAAAPWLPWILFSIEGLYQRFSWRMVVLGSIAIALQIFAGHPQTTFYTALVCGAYLIFSLVWREEKERRMRFLGAVLTLAICGVLLSAIQLLPMRELQQLSERAQIGYEHFSLFAMPPRRLFAIIFPFFFGGYALPPYRTIGWDYWFIFKWQCGYAGMSGLLLGMVALFGPRRRRLVWFWAVIAGLALLLAIGAYLPFGLNHLLYRIPVYNLFRGSYRHLYEFSFAIAVLAGLGIKYLGEMEPQQVRRALKRSVLTLTILVAGTALSYRFLLPRFGTPAPPPAQAGSLTNPEALIPLCFFVLSVVTLLLYARRQTMITGALLVLLLLLDLASFGHFFYWRGSNFRIVDRLADPPTVKYLKAREPDLNSFRMAALSMFPWGTENYELLNQPNVSIVRGVPSVNGYEPMRLPRLAAIAGNMDIFGVMRDLKSFGQFDQGLNLLKVKYLLREQKGWPDMKHEEIGFSQADLNLKLESGAHEELTPGGVPATELAIVSTMANSTHLPDHTPIVRIRLQDKNGQIIEREIQTGRDTSEWAYDHPDVRPFVKHQRARLAESLDANGAKVHRYLARLSFERAEIERIEFDCLRSDANLLIVRASLYDAPSRTSFPLMSLNLPAERWLKVERFGQVDVYENLKVMPTAWFVRRVRAMPSEKVLSAVKEGKLDNGQEFNPAEVALFETEDFGGRPIEFPPVGDPAGSEVAVLHYDPQRIELRTRNPQPAFLVLSEVYYRGWEARIDGVKTPVERVNYILRGVAVPPGEHRIEFVFRAHSFRLGAIYSGVGALVLLGGAVIRLGKRKNLKESRNLVISR
jgi:hypothetical protein